MLDELMPCCNEPESAHIGVVCPDGRVQCCVCCACVGADQLAGDDDGSLVNVCLSCEICSQVKV